MTFPEVEDSETYIQELESAIDKKDYPDPDPDLIYDLIEAVHVKEDLRERGEPDAEKGIDRQFERILDI